MDSTISHFCWEDSSAGLKLKVVGVKDASATTLWWEWRYLHDCMGIKTDLWEWLRLARPRLNSFMQTLGLEVTPRLVCEGVKEHVLKMQDAMALLLQIHQARQTKPPTRQGAAILIDKLTIAAGSAVPLLQPKELCRPIDVAADVRGVSNYMPVLVLTAAGGVQGFQNLVHYCPSIPAHWQQFLKSNQNTTTTTNTFDNAKVADIMKFCMWTSAHEHGLWEGVTKQILSFLIKLTSSAIEAAVHASRATHANPRPKPMPMLVGKSGRRHRRVDVASKLAWLHKCKLLKKTQQGGA